MAEWGYDHRRLETELTDELFVLYLDAAHDRLADAGDAAIEAVRIGTIFAHDARAYRSWRGRAARMNARRTAPLSDAALEAQLMALAAVFPKNVTRGTVARG